MKELLAEIRRHRATLEAGGALAARRRARRSEELKSLLLEEFRAALETRLASGELAQACQQVMDGRLDPYSAAQEALALLGLRARPGAQP